MHIKYIELVNWCQHQRLTMELGPGLNGVIGSNGKGKSNFLEAIRYVFTGESQNPGVKTDNLRWGAKTGYALCVVRIGDTDYTMKRWIKGAKVEMTWSDPTGGEQKIVKSDEMQRKIYALTGASPKVLHDAVFVRQGQIDAVLFQKTSERLKEFQRIFGLEGAADAYRYLGEEAGRYHLTPGLMEDLKETQDLLTHARQEFDANLTRADALQVDIEANAFAEDVLKRSVEAERQATAVANAQVRVDAAAEKVADTSDYEAQAVAAASDFHVEVGSEELSQLRTQLARLEHAMDQWAVSQSQRTALEDVTRALDQTPGIEPAKGAALEQAKAEAVANAESARRLAAGNRDPGPSEKAAQDAFAMAQADYNAHLQAGPGILSDPEVRRLNDEIEHIRRELGGFENGVCPTCGQEVNGGPEAIAEKKARAEALGQERHALCEKLQAAFDSKTADLETRLRDTRQAVETIAQQAKAFFEKKYQEAMMVVEAASHELEVARHQQNEHVRLAQRKAELEANLKNVPETRPTDDEINALRDKIAKAEADLAKLAELQKASERAQLDHEYAVKELDQAQKALAVLGTELDVPSREEVEAAREAAEKVSQWRQSLGQIEAAMASQKVAIETREREIKRLAAQAKAESQDQIWVETIRRVRDVLHSSKLPAMVMREYAKILNAQIDWYLTQWQAPFKVWIDDNLEFRAWKPNEEGADAEMDAARLSGGEKIVASVSFRLAMSDTFARKAGLVVLDEPSNYLDKTNIQHLQEVLLELRKISATSHRQVIVVTHEQQLLGFFDHVVTIGDGGALAA